MLRRLAVSIGGGGPVRQLSRLDVLFVLTSGAYSERCCDCANESKGASSGREPGGVRASASRSMQKSSRWSRWQARRVSIIYCSSPVPFLSQSTGALSGEAYKAGHFSPVAEADAVEAVAGITTRGRGSLDVP